MGYEYLANVNIDRFEPVPQTLVTTSVVNKCIDGVYDYVHQLVIRETFKESSKFGHRKL